MSKAVKGRGPAFRLATNPHFLKLARLVAKQSPKLALCFLWIQYVLTDWLRTEFFGSTKEPWPDVAQGRTIMRMLMCHLVRAHFTLVSMLVRCLPFFVCQDNAIFFLQNGRNWTKLPREQLLCSKHFPAIVETPIGSTSRGWLKEHLAALWRYCLLAVREHHQLPSEDDAALKLMRALDGDDEEDDEEDKDCLEMSLGSDEEADKDTAVTYLLLTFFSVVQFSFAFVERSNLLRCTQFDSIMLFCTGRHDVA